MSCLNLKNSVACRMSDILQCGPGPNNHEFETPAIKQERKSYRRKEIVYDAAVLLVQWSENAYKLPCHGLHFCRRQRGSSILLNFSAGLEKVVKVRMFCTVKYLIAVQGRPRSMILVSLESAYTGWYVTSYLWLSFVSDCVFYRVGQKNRTYLSLDNSAMVTRRKACDMSKVLECCRQRGPNSHSKSFKYSLLNLHRSLLSLKLAFACTPMCPNTLSSKTHCQKVQI